jgi:hypothetical protein
MFNPKLTPVAELAASTEFRGKSIMEYFVAPAYWKYLILLCQLATG